MALRYTRRSQGPPATYCVLLCADGERLSEIDEDVLAATWTKISWRRVKEVGLMASKLVDYHVGAVDILPQWSLIIRRNEREGITP